MTRTGLYNALSEVCTTFYNVADIGAQLPYIVYSWNRDANIGADNAVYQRGVSVEISVYSNDPGTVDSVESALNGLGVFWQASNNYELSDRVYLSTINFEEIEED